MKIKNVLSLFDGMACGHVALNRAGIEFDNYYASEIHGPSMKVANKNHVNIIQLGDINTWKSWDIEDIDLIIGGSPCQGFSSSGKGLNFNDPRSKLFFTFLEVLEHFKPKYFLLENVRMKAEWLQIITDHLGVDPIHIYSNLVSAQNRPRYYWCNWDTNQPTDKQIKLTSILEKNHQWHPASIVGRRINPITGKRNDHDKSLPYSQCLQVKKSADKMGCLTTVAKDTLLSSKPHGRYPDAYNKTIRGKDWRELTPIEYERLQTLPDDYTKGVGDTSRRAMLGNGWTVDVVTHLFEELRREQDE